MDGNKKTTGKSGAVEDWSTAGPSRLNTPETSQHRETNTKSTPHGRALIALDMNSADEVRQAVKSVLNESKKSDDGPDAEDGTVDSQNEDNNTENELTPEQKIQNKALFDVVRMTMKLVDEENKRSRRNEPYKQNENKKRRHSRRAKAVPRKKIKYSRVYNGRLSNVAGMKSKKKKTLNSESESERSLSSRSTKSGSSRYSR